MDMVLNWWLGSLSAKYSYGLITTCKYNPTLYIILCSHSKFSSFYHASPMNVHMYM